MSKLTDIKYWEKIQGQPCVELDSKNIIKLWIEGNITVSHTGRCLEVGCYPGRYLTIFGDKGIEVNGIDYLPEVEKLEELCKKKGYRTGKFHCLDFQNSSIDEKYDYVYSLGFIEHFDDWESVLIRHLELVSDDGFLIIEVPNFSGWMQRLPRIIFDKENYSRHNIRSMDLNRWSKILKENNFEIMKAECVGGYMLWFEKESGKFELITRKLFVRVMQLVKKMLYPKIENHESFSGALAVIARKRA